MLFAKYNANFLPQITLIGKDVNPNPHLNIKRVSEDYIFYIVTMGEMFFNEDLQEYKWFRCRVNYVSLDEEKGVEKRIAQTMMVQAIDFQDAVKALVKGMEGSLCDYEIASITETKILDAFKYEPTIES